MGSVIAVIPARGGSKRIPRKNMAPCAGKPLIAHTFAAARASRHLDRVLLSTEDTEIAAYARDNGIEVHLRPAALAADDTPMLAVLENIMAWLDHPESGGVESFVLLQPTSPLRSSQHIDDAVELFRSHPEAESVVSVTMPPHIFHPLKILKPCGERLVPFIEGGEFAVGHRNLPPAYARNGPAVLVMRPDVIRRGQIYGDVSVPYVMDRIDSVDIDDPFDLEIADLLLRRRS